MLLEALAAAIEGTNTKEVTRLAAELNNSLGSLTRDSVSTQPSVDLGDESLLKSMGPASGECHQGSSSQRTPRAKVLTQQVTQSDHMLSNETMTSKKSKPKRPLAHVEVISSDDPEDSDTHKTKKVARDQQSSSEDSESPKSRRRAAKRKALQKKKRMESEDSSSDSSSSSSDEDSSDDSADEEKAELCYDITNFDSADLPDLPDKWDKGFRKLRSYVPISLFNPALLESYHEDDKQQNTKDKSEL